jgi:hypothetical protein
MHHIVIFVDFSCYVYQFEGRSKDVGEGVKQVDRTVYAAIINVLKQFAIYRNYEGKNPNGLYQVYTLDKKQVILTM